MRIVKEKAEESEKMINGICAEIYNLDRVKKNLLDTKEFLQKLDDFSKQFYFLKTEFNLDLFIS